MKSRGIRFPGRDDESLAPIFTPPPSVIAAEVHVDQSGEVQYDSPVHAFTPEQSKEAFDVARNSIELLSTVLSSSPQQDFLQVLICHVKSFMCFIITVYDKCFDPNIVPKIGRHRILFGRLSILYNYV